MIQPLVSVIIPVFNARTTIESAIDSVVSQSYRNIELIVVDGVSSDGTTEFLYSLQKKITKLISEKDTGVYDAMNKGIEVAEGDWIYLLGADDVIADPDVIQKVVESIDQDVLFVFGKIENIGRTHSRVPHIHSSEFDGRIIWRNTVHQQSAFYHYTLFDDRQFNTEYKVLADYDFHLYLYEEDIPGKKLDLLIARCAAGGLSKNFVKSLYDEEVRMKSKHYDRTLLLYWLIQVPFIYLKFLYKKITS